MTINRNLSIKQLLNQLPFENKYLNEAVVNSLKNEGPTEVELEWFTLEESISNQNLLKEFNQRQLAVDLGAILTYLSQHPESLNEKKYIGLSIDKDTFAFFYRDGGLRCVSVNRSARDWIAGRWFGGRKVSKSLGSWPLDTLEINGYKYQLIK